MPSDIQFSDYLQSMLKSHRSDVSYYSFQIKPDHHKQRSLRSSSRTLNESYGHSSSSRARLHPKPKKEKWRPSGSDSVESANRSRRRRVHFAPIDSNSYIVPCSDPSSGGTIVSSLPCTNESGISGRYYGRVNDRMQPHGSGALILRDGSASMAIWSNGTPVEPWVPKQQTPKRRHKSKSKKPKKHSKKHKPSSSLSASANQTTTTGTLSMSMSSSSLQLHDTYLPHLEIGDKPTKYDVLESDPRKINLLQVHDFAWIMRSNNRWTYAIIAERDEGNSMIRFVVDSGGSTKVLSRKHWATSIRLVNPPRKPVAAKHQEPPQQQQPPLPKALSRSSLKEKRWFCLKPRLPMNVFISSPPITEEEQRRMATSYSTLYRTDTPSRGVEPWMDRSDPSLGVGLYSHAE